MSHPFQITTSYKKKYDLTLNDSFQVHYPAVTTSYGIFSLFVIFINLFSQDLSNSDSRRAAETMVSHSTSHLPQVLPESNFIYYFDVKFKLSYLYLLSEDRFFIFKYFKYYHSWCFWFYYFCITEKQSNLYQ